MKKCDFCINFKWKMWFFVLILNEKMWFFCKFLINFTKTPIIHDQKKMTIFCEFFGFFWIFWIFCVFCQFFGLKIIYTNRFFWAKSDKIVIFLIFVWFFLILPYIMVSKMWHFFVKFVFFHFFGDFRGLKCDFWFIF